MAKVFPKQACKRYYDILEDEPLSGHITLATALETPHAPVIAQEQGLLLVSYTPVANLASILFTMQCCPIDPDDTNNTSYIKWYNEVLEDTSLYPIQLSHIASQYIGTTANTTYNFRYALPLGDSYIKFLVWELDGAAGGSVSMTLESTTT